MAYTVHFVAVSEWEAFYNANVNNLQTVHVVALETPDGAGYLSQYVAVVRN